LSDKAEIGSSKRIFAKEYVPAGIPFYRSKEIIELGRGEQPSVELFISEERYHEIKEKYGVPQKGDLLMTAVGTIGKFWTVNSDAPFYYKDGNLMYIRASSFNEVYFRFSLEMLIDQYKAKTVNVSAYAALPIEKMKEMQIVEPPMALQEQFAAFVQQSDKSKFEIEQALAELTATYKRIIAENLG
jgi:type I restriction enzyme S subunit